MAQLRGFDYQTILNQTQNANDQIRQSQLANALKERQRELQLEDEERQLKQRQKEIKDQRDFQKEQEKIRVAEQKKQIIMKGQIDQANKYGVAIDPATGEVDQHDLGVAQTSGMLEKRRQNQIANEISQAKLDTEQARATKERNLATYYLKKEPTAKQSPRQAAVGKELVNSVKAIDELKQNAIALRDLSKANIGTVDVSAARSFFNDMAIQNAEAEVDESKFTGDEKKYRIEALVRADGGLLYDRFKLWAGERLTPETELPLMNEYLSFMGI